MENSNEINLSFSIRGYTDISHVDISKSLELKPYRVYIQGEPISRNSPKKAKRNAWVLGTSYGNKDSFEVQLERILDVLEPKVSVLKKYSQKYECEFSCAIFIYDDQKSDEIMVFNRRYNDFVKNVVVSFDFDIYYPPLDTE